MVPPAAQPKSAAPFPRPTKALMRLAGQAIADFAMIKTRDRVLVAVSGGKDSLSLLLVLHALRVHSPVPFELGAATIDPGIAGYDPAFLQEWVPKLDIPYFYERQAIAERASVHMHGSSFCAFCARMRRGALYAVARKEKFNVLAMGHHLDDLAESFLMAALHNGRLKTMKANYVVDAGDLRVIRPLVYVRERQTRDFVDRFGLPAIQDNCPACYRVPTRRMDMKVWLAQQEASFPKLFDSLSIAIRPLMSDRLSPEMDK